MNARSTSPRFHEFGSTSPMSMNPMFWTHSPPSATQYGAHGYAHVHTYPQPYAYTYALSTQWRSTDMTCFDIVLTHKSARTYSNRMCVSGSEVMHDDAADREDAAGGGDGSHIRNRSTPHAHEVLVSAKPRRTYVKLETLRLNLCVRIVKPCVCVRARVRACVGVVRSVAESEHIVMPLCAPPCFD